MLGVQMRVSATSCWPSTSPGGASPKPSSSHLGELRPGDSIVLRDAEGTAFTCAVAWVRQESALEPSAAEVWG